jgi:diguanylate cyclase (GGDEF)-like protein/PAS domain S-box-containing protein
VPRNTGLSADQLATLQSISADVAAAIDPLVLARHVVQDLHTRFGYKTASVYLLHHDGSLHLAARSGAQSAPPGEDVLSRLVQTRKGVLEHQRAYVPIDAADGLHGVLQVECRVGGTEQDLILIELLAQLMAVSLRNSESQQALTTLVANLPGMVYRCSNDGSWRMEFVSGGCLELTGHTPSAFMTGQVFYGNLIHSEDLARLHEQTAAALAEGRSFQTVYRLLTASGEEKWVWEQGYVLHGPQGDVVAREGFVTDITERKRAEMALEDSASQYRQMFQKNRAIQLLIDPLTATIVDANSAACEFYGYTPEQMRSMAMSRIAIAPSQTDLRNAMAHISEGERSSFAFQHRLASGAVRDVQVNTGPVNVGRRRLIYSIVHDVTERKRTEEALAHQALHDGLTGLPNRLLLQDRLSQAIRLADRDGRSFALCVVDLDRFKDVNDTLGQLAGDQLLQEVAYRLRNALRASDTVARLGADEFAVVLPESDVQSATLAAHKIIEALGAPVLLDECEVAVEASMGIAVYPEHGTDADTVLTCAELAMNVAKQTRSGYSVYSPDQNQSSSQRLTLVGALRRAIADDELMLYYQPKVDCRTGEVAGVEALVRWQHPQHGLIPPDRFIPLAEQTGLIRPLTRWVLNAATRQAREWHDEGLMLSVAVNLSAHDLQDTDLAKRLGEILERWGVDGRWLKLELTESALMSDPAQAMQVLTELCNLGARIAIDDFGTGYSSLGYLKRLPAHEIKIDRSFIADMVAEERDHAIVRSTIDLGHNLGLAAVAEGVEDQATLDLLGGLGCDLAQGYYLSKPLPAPNIAAWCRARADAPDTLAA